MSEKTAGQLLDEGASQAEVLGMIFPGLSSMAKVHAEKIKAARQSVDDAEDDVALDLSPSTIGAVSRLVKAHIELALLERGGS